MKILAIDPGYERLGIAILEKTPTHKEACIYSDCFSTPKTLPHHERLAALGKEIARVIEAYAPEALAIETLFFSKNQATALPVAEARGTIIYEASRNNLRVQEFSPAEIKIAVTGHGRSDKDQVTDMVKRLIKIEKEIKYDDEYDAIAIGLTYFASARSLSTGRGR